MVLYQVPLAQSTHLQNLRELQPPEKGATMSGPANHATSNSEWRPPILIATIALSNAKGKEQNSERAGQLYLLAEIITALHRQAEAMEAVSKTLIEFWAECRRVEAKR